MHTETITGLLAFVFSVWCVSSAIQTCTSKDDCYDVLCSARTVVHCTEFNTCKCEANHEVPSTCTDDKECHHMNCTGVQHKRACIAQKCTCVNPHQHNCTLQHHCRSHHCDAQSDPRCDHNVCVCVAITAQGNHTG